MDHFPDIQFYDYTKLPSRMMRFVKGNFPSNYHLSFSWSGENSDICQEVLAKRGTVVVIADIAKKDAIPIQWTISKTHYPTIDGDADDLRFYDPPATVILLRPKGRARKATRGKFVQPNQTRHPKQEPANMSKTVNEEIADAIRAHGSRFCKVRFVTVKGDELTAIFNPRSGIKRVPIASVRHVEAAETRAANNPDLWNVVDYHPRKWRKYGRPGVTSFDLSRVLSVGDTVFRVQR